MTISQCVHFSPVRKVRDKYISINSIYMLIWNFAFKGKDVTYYVVLYIGMKEDETLIISCFYSTPCLDLRYNHQKTDIEKN